jgi:endonuclease G, mitochondrial
MKNNGKLIKTCLSAMLLAISLMNHAVAAVIDRDCPQFVFKGAPVHFQKGVNDNSVFLCHKAYAVQYFAGTKTPLWVAEKLLGSATSGGEERTNDFMPDPNIDPRMSARIEDYKALNRNLKSNGKSYMYDKGHMAPAGDFSNDEEAMHQSFYLSNMVPQVNRHNQGIWRDLEMKVRQWARSRGALFIVTGPIFRNGKAVEQLKNGPAVPTDIYKVVVDPQNGESIAFVIPNQPYETVRQKRGPAGYELNGAFFSLDSFIVPIEEVESLAQLKISPFLNQRDSEYMGKTKSKMWAR